MDGMPLASVIGLVVAKRASASGMIVIVSAVLVTLAIDSFPVDTKHRFWATFPNPSESAFPNPGDHFPTRIARRHSRLAAIDRLTRVPLGFRPSLARVLPGTAARFHSPESWRKRSAVARRHSRLAAIDRSAQVNRVNEFKVDLA